MAVECSGNALTATEATRPRFSADALIPSNTDITQRIHSGIYEGTLEDVTTAKGWPVNAQYTHLLALTHSNEASYYSMQIAGLFSAQRFFVRNTVNNGSTPWVEIIHTGNVGTALNYAGSTTPGGAATVATALANNTSLVFGANGLQYFNFDGPAGTSPSQNVTPYSDWFHVLRMNHPNSTGYYTDIVTPLNANGIWYRRVALGINHGWYQLMDSVCYPNLQAIENLAGTAGVPVKTAANTWELKNGFTGAKVIGGTTCTFVNGLLVS